MSIYSVTKNFFKKRFSTEQWLVLREKWFALRKTVRNLLTELKTPFMLGNLTLLARLYGTDKYVYTQHYMNHLRKFKNKKIKILEIGVGGYADPKYGGHSLRMWKKYFPFANIYGIDICDKTALQERRIKIYQGNQVDREFLERITNEIGPLDIIIDDGSHQSEHIIETFKILFPKLKDTGIYVVEDLSTAYWDHWGGDSKNLNNPKTAMNFLKSLTDCLNHSCIVDENYIDTYFDNNIVSMHFYPSLAFIYKGDNNERANIWVKNHKMLR